MDGATERFAPAAFWPLLAAYVAVLTTLGITAGSASWRASAPAGTPACPEQLPISPTTVVLWFAGVLVALLVPAVWLAIWGERYPRLIWLIVPVIVVSTGAAVLFPWAWLLGDYSSCVR